MKTILVATDFSPAATNAASYAAEMALTIDANKILLLHVYQIPVGYLEVQILISHTKQLVLHSYIPVMALHQ